MTATIEPAPALALALPMLQGATEQRIVDSARGCFEAVGVDRTRMDEIAAEAGVSRQTIYKYFSSKADIVDRIAHLEMVKVNALLRRRVPRGLPFAERLTEAIQLSVEISRENPYLMRTVADPRLMPRYADTSAALFLWQERQWSAFIDRARRTGELAVDLDTDRVVRWIMLSQLMLLLTPERLPLGEGASRAFVRRFMVEPLLAGRVSAPVEPDARIAALEAENQSLRAILATQALALHAHEQRGEGPDR